MNQESSVIWPLAQPTLTDGDLTLRPVVAADAPTIFAYIDGDEDIAEWTTVPYPYMMQDAIDAVEKWSTGYDNKEMIQFAITVNDGPIVGTISLQYLILLDHNAEIGYIISRDARGQGIATRATKLLTDFAFEIGFRRINALVMPDNIGSQKTLLKSGYYQEAVMRDFFTRRNGEQCDALSFACLVSDRSPKH
jgi:RimJ/RimL family protein N-acetyltransferase